MKQTLDCREEIDITERSMRKWIPKGFIQLSKYHKWDYIEGSHLLLGESGSGKSKVLYGLIYKFLGRQQKIILFICDGKENYTTLVSIF